MPNLHHGLILPANKTDFSDMEAAFVDTGCTLSETWATVGSVTGVTVSDAYVDKGYRSHGHTDGADVPSPNGVARTRHAPNESENAVASRSNRQSAISSANIGWAGASGQGHVATRSTPRRPTRGVNLRKRLGLLHWEAERFAYALIRWIENMTAAGQSLRISYSTTE